MSLKEQDRATLVVLGLEKSDKMLDAANWLIVVMGTDSGLYPSRICPRD